MTNDIRLAFAHPLERAEATSGAGPLDRISLRDHIVNVEIGAFQAERGVTQRIAFNVVVEVEPLGAEIDDDVDRILSYDRVTEAIAAELAFERLALLETLAVRVAERILLEPQAVRVFVRIEKLDRGAGALGVEIVRSREESTAPELAPEEALQPEVVFLSNTAIASPHFVGWLDQLDQIGRPVILCVGPSDLPAPQAAHDMPQRRIDLLAIEQNAWVLAARDDRCVVVGTRTEIDWAMKNGQTCVWAPSKIVLDAVEGPVAPNSNPVALAAWFAAEIGAQQMLMIGGDAPENAPIPLKSISTVSVDL